MVLAGIERVSPPSHKDIIMLTKPARESNVAPLSSVDALQVRSHIYQALILIPRHNHNKGKSPKTCDNCIMLTHMIDALKYFKRIGE